MAADDLPQWHNRDTPLWSLEDGAPEYSGYEDTMHVVSVKDGMSDEAVAFVESINTVRQPLHAQMQALVPPVFMRFYTPAVAAYICEKVGPPAYPVRRMAVTEDLEDLPAFQDAISQGLASAESETRYEPLMGVSHIQRRYVEEGDPLHDFDVLAASLGRAAVSGPVDVYRDENSSPRVISGTQWMEDGEIRGELLSEALAIKLAAMACRDFHIKRQSDRSPVSGVEQYDYLNYSQPAALVAAGIDLINQKAGVPAGQPGLFKLLVDFARMGRSTVVRQKMVRFISHATGGNPSLRLEHLEAQRNVVGLPVGLLYRIEEALEIDENQRLSAVFA